jgi:hypothetical protein
MIYYGNYVLLFLEFEFTGLFINVPNDIKVLLYYTANFSQLMKT